MRKREVFIIFLMLFVTMAIFTIPLWWEYAQPHIVRLIDHVQGVLGQ